MDTIPNFKVTVSIKSGQSKEMRLSEAILEYIFVIQDEAAKFKLIAQDKTIGDPQSRNLFHAHSDALAALSTAMLVMWGQVDPEEWSKTFLPGFMTMARRYKISVPEWMRQENKE